jgi:RNA-directed DNA polymerase
MEETKATAVATPAIEDWTQTPWHKLEHHVYRIQKRIYKAQSRGKVKVVHSLQRLLMRSRAARMLAVRRVTQDNQGKKTAGVDGLKAVGPLVRLLFVERLGHPETIRARPVRRVFIPKPGKDEQRALGIPVMLDRAHQTLAKLALEPQWEARFEPNSYGFRPGRSCHDAIEAIFTCIATKDKFVLDADIKGCFDNIGHQALLDKLESTPSIRHATKAWLKAGVLHDGAFTPTTSGSPQGGCISPLLANIALHGMEAIAVNSYRRWTKGTLIHPTLVRFADDFVILCADNAGIETARRAVEQFLGSIGLHLSPSKTRVSHTLRLHEGNVGFDFLGFTIRQFPAGKTRSGKKQNGKLLGHKTIITPSKAAIKTHVAALHTIVKQHKSAPQATLITALNRVIPGWARYYCTVVSSAVFTHCDSHLYAQLRHWANFRHPNKGASWIVRRYWRLHPRWDFIVSGGVYEGLGLRDHTEIHHRKHVKVRGNASVYDGKLVYWAARLKDHPLTGGIKGRLLALQQGRCPSCGLHFKDGDLLELDHLVPLLNRGSEHYTNKQVLHRHCHDQKHGHLTVGYA